MSTVVAPPGKSQSAEASTTYSASVAASLLRLRGFGDVSDVLGGYGAWIETTQSA